MILQVLAEDVSGSEAARTITPFANENALLIEVSTGWLSKCKKNSYPLRFWSNMHQYVRP